MLPPLYICDSSAQYTKNCVKVNWLVDLRTGTGRYGCPAGVKSDSFYAIYPRGSMVDTLLNQNYVESVIVYHYLNIHKTAVFDGTTAGKLNEGPVIFNGGCGTG